MKRLRAMLFAILGLVLILGAAVVWMAGGLQAPRSFDGPIQQVDRVVRGPQPPEPDPTTLRVVVWNIAWAYGWGSEGSGSAKPPAHFERNLDRMARVLAAAKPDLVLLQEVDFDSTRSHGTNQAERLARQAGLPFVAPAVSWSANWVPFPYWPPSDHFGRMRSGGAVLSRYPIQRNQVELLPKPTKNPWWYNMFFLFRYVQQVEIEHPAGGLRVVNVHFEAFDPANRLNQAHRAREILDGLTAPFIVFGGDLNAVPPESPQRHGYPDEPQTDHRKDETVETLRSARTVADTMPMQAFTSTPSAWFTFPAHERNRKLDYIFASDRFEVVSTRVLTEAEDASDHLPIVAELRFGPPDDDGASD